MKVVGLISGGKDSIFNLFKCKQLGHEVVCLANLVPDTGTETDSYMYQTVGSECIQAIARVTELPLFRRIIKGRSIEINEYQTNPEDEVEDLYVLLKTVKQAYPDVKGVSVGAIASDYQKKRVEHVCERLDLEPLCLLWGADQRQLLQEMLDNGLDIITVKVAALGLNDRHLGMHLSELQPHLHKLNESYGVHICGEGGEYESLVLFCPNLYQETLSVASSDKHLHSPDDVAPVWILSVHLAEPSIPANEGAVVFVRDL